MRLILETWRYSTSMGDLLNCHQICGIDGFNGPRICNGPYPWVWQSWHRPCCLVQSCRALGSAIRTTLGNASRSCSIPYPGHPTELKKRKPVISWWAQFILGHKTAFAFSTISSHRDGTGSWNPSPGKTRTYRSYTAITMVGMSWTQGARASAAMVLVQFVLNFLISVPEWLN